MFYVKFTADTPYCGTEQTVYDCYEKRPTDAELNERAEMLGRDNAEGFEYLINGWDEDVSDEELDNYYADCCWDWEEISQEEFEENA